MTTERSGECSDEGGDPPCWAHLFGDDSEEPATDAAAVLGSAGWKQLVDGLADAVLVADRDGTITYWNQAAERIFGWSATEAVGANLDLIIPERLRRRHWEGYSRAVATGRIREDRQLLEVPAQRRDGRPLSIAFTLSVLTEPAVGRVDRLVAVVRDDTERWQERRRLRAEVSRLQAGAVQAEAAP